MEYSYPMDESWNVDEICIVIDFYNCIEEAYEGGIQKKKLMAAYKAFKTIVDSKSMERRISDEFEEASGYSIYHTMKACKELENEKAMVKM